MRISPVVTVSIARSGRSSPIGRRIVADARLVIRNSEDPEGDVDLSRHFDRPLRLMAGIGARKLVFGFTTERREGDADLPWSSFRSSRSG